MNESQDLVFIDDLTKVFNRRFLLNRMKDEIVHSEKRMGGFSIILLDIDNFKIVNDSFGHLAGDEALGLFSLFIKDSVRKNDIICRYAGDEFVIILPDADIKRSLECGKRIIDKLDKKDFALKSAGANVRFSVSMGSASYPEDAQNVQGLLEIADKGLYEAKRKGGGKILRFKAKSKEDSETRLNFDKFIGREGALSVLKSTLEDVSESKGKAIFVTGEVGIGKTRLLKEIMRFADLIGFYVIYERAVLQKVTSPYSMFRSIIKKIIKTLDGEVMDDVIKEISVWREGISWLVPELFMKRGGDDVYDRDTGDVQKHYIYESIAKFLCIVSNHFPLFIFLDDLQWACEDDVEVLRFLIANIEERRIFVTGSFREREISGEKNSLKKVISLLARDGLCKRISLGPLSHSEVRELVCVALGLWEVPTEIIHFINEITEGNPFFIVEVLKILIKKGYAYKSGNTWNFLTVKEMVLPERISDILKDKIESLSEDVRNLLMTASVIGELFSVESLKDITGENEGYLIDLLDEALTKGVIVEVVDSIGEYRFIYRMMQRVLYSSLSSTRRGMIHRKIGEILEGSGEDVEEKNERLAYHFKRAGQYKKALKYYLLCAQEAERVIACQKAIELYTEALQLSRKISKSDSHLFEIYYKLGNLHTCVGKLYKAEEFFLETMKLASISEDKQYQIFHELGRLYTKRGGFEKAMEYFNRSRALLPQSSTVERAMISNDEAAIFLKKGEYKRAFDLAQDALKALGEECVEERSELLNTLGNTNFFLGKLDDSLTFFNKSLHLARKCSNEKRIAVAYKNIGQVFLEQGKKWDAEKYFKQSLTFAQRVGDLFLMGKVYNNLGVNYSADDLEKARENFMNSLDIKRKIGDDDGVAVIFNNIGNLYVRQGELKKALSMFEEALRIWSLMETPPALVVTYLNIGGIYYLEKNFEKSFYYTFMAKELAHKIHYVNGEIASIIHLAQILINEEKASLVHELIGELEKLNEIYRSDDYDINIALLRANISFDNAEIGEAEKFYNYIIENVSKIRDKNLEKRVEIFGGRLLAKQGNFKEALRYLDRAMKLCEATQDTFGVVSVLYFSALLFHEEREEETAQKRLLRAKEILSKHSSRLWAIKVNALLREVEDSSGQEDS
jgi:adenylate cyclase